MEKTTKEEFIKMLDDHDWHYRRSDDPGAFKRGQSKESKIENAETSNPELKKVYDDYVFERFGYKKPNSTI